MLERENKSSVSCILTLKIGQNEYMPNVENALDNYRKKVNIPGFRKGAVPISMIKAKYEKPLKYEEVNKLIQKNLYDYIIKEKLNLLGSPIQIDDNINWEDKDLVFRFELGLFPEVEIDLSKLKINTNYFKIKLDENEIEEQVIRYQNQLGDKKEKEIVELDDIVYGLVDFGTEKNNFSFDLKKIKNLEPFLNKKKEDKIDISIEDLFKDVEDLNKFLQNISNEIKENKKDFVFTIENIFLVEKHPINQDFFDKLFGKDKVKNEEDMRIKLREESIKNLQEDADKFFIFQVMESMIEQIKFETPDDFLKRWIMLNNKNVTKDNIDEVYSKEEKILRKQIIESNILKSNNVEIKESDIEEKIREVLNIQMAMYGSNIPEEKLNEMIKNIMNNNEKEVERVRGLIIADKMLDIIKEKIKYIEKEVSFKDYIDEISKNK